MTTTNLGRVAVVPKGTYTAGTHKPLDMVRYNGASYIAKTTTTALPTVTSDWDLVVSDGVAGAAGSVGPQGPAGADGTNGVDGVSLYTWVKYADDASGANLSDSPTGKGYIGIAINKTSATESTTASDYEWALFGSDGTARILQQTVTNATGVNLTKGQAVYINGANGTNITIALAKADAELTSSKTLGILAANILDGQTGLVITEGILTTIDTSSATAAGDSVWLSSTVAGGLVFGTPPIQPAHGVYLGVVSRKHANNGEILVKVQNGYELDELHNVKLTSVVNNNVLKYDSVSSLWLNDSIKTVNGISLLGSGDIVITGGSGTVTSVAMTVPSFLSITGSPITESGTLAVTLSGTALPVANGGTGATTLAGANIDVISVASTFTGTKTFNGTSTTLAAIFANAAETTTVSATAATGTIPYYTATQSVMYYTNNASANWTLNIRHSAGTTLNTAMTTGQTITITFMVTNGATAYYNNVVQVDGTTVTPKWQGGTAPSSGNASSIDVYTYAIIKTAAATFTVLAAVSKFS